MASSMGSLLPTGAFDSVADDDIWGSAASETSSINSSSSPQPRAKDIDISCAFDDVDVDMDTDTSAPMPTKPTTLPKNENEKQMASSSTTEAQPSHTHQELFLLGSTYSSNKTTVEYVSANLAHILEINLRASAKLARKLKRDKGEDGISLGIMTLAKCKETEEKLRLRDIDCRSVAATSETKAVQPTKATSTKKKKKGKPIKSTSSLASDEASATASSVASSIPPLPPRSGCDRSIQSHAESQSHNSQTPTPKMHNLKKAIGGRISSSSPRKPNFVSSLHKRTGSNASSITFGDMMKARKVEARKRTEEAVAEKKNKTKSNKKANKSSSETSASPAKGSKNQQKQAASESLVFSSGVYEGEKRDGKPNGKGTFTMRGQFSYIGDWVDGNPTGIGTFKLASGEIREGSWEGTTFIEHRRYNLRSSSQPSQPKAKALPKEEDSAASVVEERAELPDTGKDKVVATPIESPNIVNSIGQFDIVVEESFSPSESSSEPQATSPHPLLKKASTMSSSGFPPECASYLAKLKVITKPSTAKSGSVRVQGDKNLATVTFEDIGGKYDGEWKGDNLDGLPNGMGSFDWDDGAHYYGEWTDGVPSGDGRFKFANGQVYSRCNLNGAMTPDQIPNTPATEASSQPSDTHHIETSPTSTVTISPVLTRSQQQRKRLPESTNYNSTGIDIPPLGDTSAAERLTFGQLLACEDPKPKDGASPVDIIGGKDDAPPQQPPEPSPPTTIMRLSSLLPYKRGPSIPKMTSFKPKEETKAENNTDNTSNVTKGAAADETSVSIKEKEEMIPAAMLSTNNEEEKSPLVFVDDGSTSSVQSPCKGGLMALIQETVDEEPESVRHILESFFVIKLDETRQEVMKFLDAGTGRTSSAAYFYPEIGTYNGEFVDGQPHGVGSFFWLDGTTYSGNWEEGEPEGDGKIIFPSGEMFVRCADSNEIIHIPPAQDDKTETESNDKIEGEETKGEPPRKVASLDPEDTMMTEDDKVTSIPEVEEGSTIVRCASPLEPPPFATEGGKIQAEVSDALPANENVQEKGKAKAQDSKAPSPTEPPFDVNESGEVQGEVSGAITANEDVQEVGKIQDSSAPSLSELPFELIQEKVDEEPESVRHILESFFVIKLDETRQEVKKFLEAAGTGHTSSAAYFYPEIGTYNGEFVDGQPHGVGSFFWLDGTTYSGNWEEGEPEGDGKIIFPSGEMFVRCADSNEIIHIPPSQDDKTETESNDKIEEEETKGEPPRKVASLDPDDTMMTEDDKVTSIPEVEEGSTIVRCASPLEPPPDANECGDIQAEVSDALSVNEDVQEVNAVTKSPKRTDSSLLESEDAGKYKGEIVGGVPHGLGSMCFADGTRYTGQWRNGKPAKEGTFYFPNGERHYGRWNSSTFEPIKKGHVDDKNWSDSASVDLSQSSGSTSFRLTTVEEESTEGISSTGSKMEHASPRQIEERHINLDDDSSPRANRIGGVTHLDSPSVGNMSGIESILAAMEMSVFSEMEDLSVFSQLSGMSSTASPKQQKKKAKFSLSRPKKEDTSTSNKWDETSVSQGSTSRGSSVPIDVDEATFYESDDDDEEVSRITTSTSSRSQRVRSGKNDCVYYNGYTAECRPYLSSLRSIRLFSTKKSGSLHLDHGKNVAGVTYSGIGGEYDGEWRGSMLKGTPHGFGQFSWGDGTCYSGNWNRGVPSGNGEFIFRDGKVVKRGKGVVLVQSLARGHLARKAILKEHNAATTIQDAWKNHIIAKHTLAAVTVQLAWRKHDAPRREIRDKSAALIQDKYRSRIIRKNAATRIQSHIRSTNARALYLEQRSSASIIQARYRPHIITKNVAATRIQSHVRSTNTRALYLKQRSSASVIQAQARSRAARSSLKKIVCACTILQARTRGMQLRKSMEARYIDVDAMEDDASICEEIEPAQEEDNIQEQSPYLAALAQVYPPECSSHLLSLKTLTSMNRKGYLYWHDKGKHAFVSYTNINLKYKGEWKGTLIEGLPHGNGKVKFSDGTRFYDSAWVNGIPSSNGHFKFTNGRILYSKCTEEARKDMLQEMTGISSRLEDEYCRKDLHDKYKVEAEALRKSTMEERDKMFALASRLKDEYKTSEQKRTEGREATLARLEADLAEKQAAAAKAIAAAKEAVGDAYDTNDVDEKTKSIVDTIKQAELPMNR